MPTFRLVSATGDQTFELKDGRTLVVGRGLTSDIAIYDPTISRRHAELTVGADGVQVKDLDSSNGTCINGARITTGRLGSEDTVTFGKVTFRLASPGSAAVVQQRPAIAAEAPGTVRRKSTLPKVTVSSSPSRPEATRVPLMQVPFELSRSLTWTPSAPTVSSACRREMVGS